MLSKRGNSRLWSLVSVTIAVVVLVVAGWIISNKQLVSDSVIGFFHQPTKQVLELESRVKFSAEGKRVFRATQPELSGAEVFNSQCPRREVKSPIIGCYTSDDRVYIYNVTNPELDGIEEVTAAHEMLHAAWVRLSSHDRDKLGALLQDAYSSIKKDSLRERIDYYARTEPTEINNELHSILGTEHMNLGSELEKHYSRYFKDRSLVVGFHDQYNGKYTALQEQSDSLWKQLDKLAKAINSNQDSYLVESDKLNSDIEYFNQRASSGSFSSQQAFDNERSILTSRIANLEVKRTQINKDIDRYKQLYESYAQVASQIEDLNKSIDSFESLEALPTL